MDISTTTDSSKLLLAPFVADYYATVCNCAECARHFVKLRNSVGDLKLFPARATFQAVYIYILGELFRTGRGFRYIVVITGHFTKLVNTVICRVLTTTEVPSIPKICQCFPWDLLSKGLQRTDAISPLGSSKTAARSSTCTTRSWQTITYILMNSFNCNTFPVVRV